MLLSIAPAQNCLLSLRMRFTMATVLAAVLLPVAARGQVSFDGIPLLLSAFFKNPAQFSATSACNSQLL
jgi:hypothetical protein